MEAPLNFENSFTAPKLTDKERALTRGHADKLSNILTNGETLHISSVPTCGHCCVLCWTFVPLPLGVIVGGWGPFTRLCPGTHRLLTRPWPQNTSLAHFHVGRQSYIIVKNKVLCRMKKHCLAAENFKSRSYKQCIERVNKYLELNTTNLCPQNVTVDLVFFC